MLLVILSFNGYSSEITIAINERDIYRFRDADGVWHGKDIELIRALFGRVPYHYKLIAMPWTRVLKSLENGSIDMAVAAAVTPDRQVYARFSREGYRHSYHVLYANIERIDNSSPFVELADIKQSNLLVGAIRGALYSERYQELLQDPEFISKMVFIDYEDSLVEMALKGRIDGFFDSEIEHNYFLKQNPQYIGKFKPLFRISTSQESMSRLIFSKKAVSQAVVDEFDVALAELHASGEYNEIANRYLQPN